MTGGSIDGHALALVLFVAFVSVSLLLCGLAAADSDDPEQFYTGSATARPAASGLAVAGDYISVATLLSTTGSVALVGYDGVLFAFATVLSLTLLAVVLAKPCAAGTASPWATCCPSGWAGVRCGSRWAWPCW
ncbi:hypothetical protein ACFQ60_44320 [Streptomyces zhihengii]